MSNSEQPLPKPFLQKIKPILVILGLGLAGAAFGYFVTQFFITSEVINVTETDNGLSPFWFIGIAIVLGAVTIFLHECGHLLGGRLVGFRFLLLIVGPLQIVRVNENQLRVQLNRNLALAGGLAAAVPQDNHNLARRMLVMVAGGPAMNLLLAAGSGLAAGFLPSPWNLVLIIFAALNIGIGLVTLVPMKTSGFHTDGARILMLLKGGEQAQRWVAALNISYLSLLKRPREIDPALINAALANPDGSLDAVGAHLIGYMSALDRGEIETAERLLAYAIEHHEAYPDGYREAIWIEAAYMAARKGDAAAARHYLRNVKSSGLVEGYTRVRVEATILQAEGQTAQAQALARKGLDHLHKYNPGAAAEFERAELEALAAAA